MQAPAVCLSGMARFSPTSRLLLQPSCTGRPTLRCCSLQKCTPHRSRQLCCKSLLQDKTTSGSKTTGGSKTSGGTKPSGTAGASKGTATTKDVSAKEVSKSQGKVKKTPPSALDVYIRKHPFFSRFYDTTLILGDCVMLAATEVASERISWDSMPMLTAVMLTSWVLTGAWLGDYTGKPPLTENWYLSLLGPPFTSLINSTLTWGLSIIAALATYSVLVANNLLDAAPLMEGINTEDLSPQLEVAVALLITMACWRGIASKIRWS